MAGTSFLPPAPQALCRGGWTGQSRAAQGAAGLGASRRRCCPSETRRGGRKSRPGHGAALSNFPGAGSLRDFGRTRKIYGRRRACVDVCGCCTAGAGNYPPHAPTRSPGLPRKKRPPVRGCPGAPGLGGSCGSGAEGVRGDTNGKRYGRKRHSGWDINQAEYTGS